MHVGGNVAGQNLQFNIRGVAQNDFNDQTESPVAVYTDDTYVAMAQGQKFAMYDLDRVEILKGPQGTYSGWSGWRYRQAQSTGRLAVLKRWRRRHRHRR